MTRQTLAFALGLAALGVVALSSELSAQSLTSIPLEKGLPVKVNAAVAYTDLQAFNENAGTFKATVDIRLRWEDPRLRQPVVVETDPPKVYRGADAEAQLAKIWTPTVELTNQRDKATYTAQGLRIYPDGRVELIKRTTADFAMNYDVGRFPFDRQKLQLDLAIRNQTSDMVALEFDQADLDFSRATTGVKLDGWNVGLVGLQSETLDGWYGFSHAKLMAFLEVARQPGPIVAAIFLPLFASLLIPVLAIWLNRTEDGRFQIEAFELTNLIIGGLFAVIALNFTVNSAYQVLSTGPNPVNKLFALNYIALGVSLLINIFLVRFEFAGRLFGRYVQEQLYQVTMWTVPLLALTMAVAIILVAFL
jgi:hypothetical protein